MPWAHESTHLGDEYVILAQKKPGFERVNVSYEYMELGVSPEWAFGDHSLLKARYGLIRLWGSDGYYSDHLLGSDEKTLSVSQKNTEHYFGAEYRHKTTGSRQFFVSLDFRSRLQYSFHHPASGPERRRPTWTLAIGQAVPEESRSFQRSYFFYFTHGVNPYGQLREQYPYKAMGIGWNFQ